MSYAFTECRVPRLSQPGWEEVIPLPATILLLIRHGATQANVCRPYLLQGLQPDSDLIELGIAQARATGKVLQSYSIQKGYCSPLRRARFTAQLLAEPLHIPLEAEESLVEADLGWWTGLTWVEIERRWPGEYRAFQEDPERHGYPGGENLAQVRDRVLPVMGELIERHRGETFLVVSHGLVNRVLLANWLGLPLGYARKLPQENAGVNLIEFRGAEAKVRTVNSIAHLAGLLPEEEA